MDNIYTSYFYDPSSVFLNVRCLLVEVISCDFSDGSVVFVCFRVYVCGGVVLK